VADITSAVDIIRTVSILKVTPHILVEWLRTNVSEERDAVGSSKSFVAAKLLDLTTLADMNTWF
jgi:hypothetical protein